MLGEPGAGLCVVIEDHVGARRLHGRALVLVLGHGGHLAGVARAAQLLYGIDHFRERGHGEHHQFVMGGLHAFPEVRVLGIAVDHLASRRLVLRELGLVGIHAAHPQVVLRFHGIVGAGTDPAHADDEHLHVARGALWVVIGGQ